MDITNSDNTWYVDRKMYRKILQSWYWFDWFFKFMYIEFEKTGCAQRINPFDLTLVLRTN